MQFYLGVTLFFFYIQSKDAYLGRVCNTCVVDFWAIYVFENYLLIYVKMTSVNLPMTKKKNNIIIILIFHINIFKLKFKKPQF